MLEFNTTITFPAAPLLTVILALVGKFLLKVEKILKGSLDLIPSPTPSVKLQIIGGKVCLRRKRKTLLGIVKNLFVFKSLLTTPRNVLFLHLPCP